MDPNGLDTRGKTALIWSVEACNPAAAASSQASVAEAEAFVVFLLETMKANVTVKDKAGNSALSLVGAMSGKEELAAVLNAHVPTAASSTPAAQTTEHKVPEVKSSSSHDPSLLPTAAPAADQCFDSIGALRYAVWDNQWPVVQWLIVNAQAVADVPSFDGFSALTKAAHVGEWEEVKWLITNGQATANARDKDGRTVLMHGVFGDNLPFLKWFFSESHPDLNVQDKDGRTALMHAAEKGLLDLVRWLALDAKADMNVKTKSGDTALLLVKPYHDKEHVDVYKWLVAHKK